MTNIEITDFQDQLLHWYNGHKRDLPWRETTDAYSIWISEIILQQTRVKQGYEYYLRFIKKFPNIKTLANADEQEVLKLWQGLGYYSRARNLHKAAKRIIDDFEGLFPSDFEQILSLPGIGDYTASATISFAFKKPYAVLDGNVFRVLSRLFADKTPIQSTTGRKHFKEYATHLLNTQRPDIHNQAMMEFGALQCTPAPNCKTCVVANHCEALKQNRVLDFPVKTKKIKQRVRYFNYLFATQGNKTFISKREKKDIWRNLYEFPLIETKEMTTWNELVEKDEVNKFFGNDFEFDESVFETTHILTHQKIVARFFILKSTKSHSDKLIETTIEKLSKDYPIPRLIDVFLNRFLERN